MALLLVVLVGGEASAYAHTANKYAPTGWQTDGALTRREGRDMADDEETAGSVGSTSHAEEITRWVDELRAAALAGNLETMRRTFGALVGTVKDAFPQPSWVDARKAEEAEWVALMEPRLRTPAERRRLERYVGTGTQLRGYEPEEGGGELAARIHDGEARVPWFPPHEGVRDEDFANGRELLEAVVEAFVHGDRENLSRLDAARLTLTGGRDSMPVKVARFAAFIAAEVERVKSGRPAEGSEESERARVRGMLAASFDPAFGSLPLAYIGKVLREASGEGVGPRTAAAELSVRAKALDAWKANVAHPKLVDDFKDRIKKAETRARMSERQAPRA